MSKSVSNKQKMQKMCDDLCRKSHFKKSEVDSLLKEYHDKSGPPKGSHMPCKLDRTKFRDILHGDFNFTDDMVMDRVFKAFDQDSDGIVSMEEWVKGLSIFLKGEVEEQIKFCFEVYDLNGDGYISREEMFHMLKSCLVKPTSDEDPDEGIKDLVELALKKMDIDNDHRVSFKDYHDSVVTDPLCLEYFGRCLPDHHCCTSYLHQKLDV